MFCLRGEKAVIGQSSDRPSAYLIGRLPKPTMAGPHILGFSPVARLNISNTAKASALRSSFSTERRNSSTLASVARVLGSYLAILFDHFAPAFVDHYHREGIQFAIPFQSITDFSALF